MSSFTKILFLVVLFIPQLGAFQACLKLTRSTDIFIKEQGVEGFDEIVLYNGDTLCVPPHLKNYDNAPLQKGMFIHYHISDDSIRVFFAAEGTSIIRAPVHEYVKDSSYMLIDQKPMDSVFGKYIRKYYNDTNYYVMREYDTVSNYKNHKLMMENSKIHSYWIVGIKTADVYGPLTFDKFEEKKKELRVPESLKLQSEK